MALIAFCAASTPASSVKWSRRVPVEAPEPFALRDSTMAVANAVISDVSSVWARGIVVDALAQDGDVAAQDETQPAQRLVVPGQLGQPARRGERAERAARDLPARLDQARVVEVHQARIVIVREGPRRGGGGRERHE